MDSETMHTESVIDFPKDGLCPDVWEKIVKADASGYEWVLTEEALSKLMKVFSYLKSIIISYGEDIPLGAHITGSMTSNCYTDSSDIDLHVYCTDGEYSGDSDKLTEFIREKFDAEFKVSNPDDASIGSHPVEVYFQKNIFQDMMSVGCFDLLSQKWIVGPDFTSQEFNPYSEYYKDIKKTAAQTAKKMRDIILGAYEAAVVLKKQIENDPEGSQQRKELRDDLTSKLKEAVSIYAKARKQRKTLSEPHSKEEALKYRTSREWHVSDAAFKLFDKFGYLAILKGFGLCYSSISNGDEDVDEEAAAKVISLVKDSIGNPEKLAEEDFDSLEEASVDEGIVKNVVLAALLAVPGIVDAKDIKQSLSTSGSKYEQTVQDVNRKVRMVGRYTAFQAANIIARTLYAEARSEGEEGMRAVASVIYNRAKGKDADFALACIKPWQFSCWNGLSVKRPEQLSPQKFQIKIPSSVVSGSGNEKAWKTAMMIAGEMLSKSFAPTISANSYYVTMMKKPPKWKNQLTDRKEVGRHTFGTLKYHSEFV